MLNAAAQVVTTPVDWRGKALLSGSYHPLHGGHLALGKAAASFLGREVLYELPLANADKAPIPLSEAQRRAAQFAARAPLVLTRAALFADKAALFPGAVFVVGADTAERLVDTRFYGGSARNMDAALAALAERGCRLLVAGRRGGGRFLTLRHLAPRIPAAHRGLFLELPEARFRRDIPSGCVAPPPRCARPIPTCAQAPRRTDMLARRRALPAGRLAALGASRVPPRAAGLPLNRAPSAAGPAGAGASSTVGSWSAPSLCSTCSARRAARSTSDYS